MLQIITIYTSLNLEVFWLLSLRVTLTTANMHHLSPAHSDDGEVPLVSPSSLCALSLSVCSSSTCMLLLLAASTAERECKYRYSTTSVFLTQFFKKYTLLTQRDTEYANNILCTGGIDKLYMHQGHIQQRVCTGGSI